MHIYDATLTLTTSLPVWPGDPAFQITQVSQIEKGDSATVSRIDMGVHTGTHVDAPAHFLGETGGKVDQMALKLLTGRAYVIQMPDDVSLITRAVLEKTNLPPRTRRLLFRTRNSRLWAQGITEFQTNFVAISADGAEYLVERGIRVVGVDYLSVAPFDASIPTHRILLEKNIIVIEGLDLSSIPQGRYSLYCLPMKLGGAEGAPARVILVGV